MPFCQYVLLLTEAEQAQLSSNARSRSIPTALSVRARIVLAAAEGEPISHIARRMQVDGKTVGKWRGRFIERRIPGLYDELRPGKPRTIDGAQVEAAHWGGRLTVSATA